MANPVCGTSIELLNTVFSSGLIFNDGHELRARLEAGDDVAQIVEDLNNEFGNPRMGTRILRIMRNWPPLHLEFVTETVAWALSKLDTADRVMINWKGDAEHDETVTKVELRDHTLLIEFAHPPFEGRAAREAATAATV